MTNVVMSHPVFVGDTLYAESLCTALRESASRPYAGIVGVHTAPSISMETTASHSIDR